MSVAQISGQLPVTNAAQRPPPPATDSQSAARTSPAAGHAMVAAATVLSKSGGDLSASKGQFFLLSKENSVLPVKTKV